MLTITASTVKCNSVVNVSQLIIINNACRPSTNVINYRSSMLYEKVPH